MSVARYTLRASPAKGVGGVYATSQGDGKPVTVAALGPDPTKQNWAMIPGSIPEDKYRVCLYNPDNNFSSGWTPAGEKPIPGEPLILTEDTGRHIVWRLEKFDAPDGVENAYTLKAVVDVIGSTWYAGTDGDRNVVIVPVPVVPDVPKEIIPYWVLDRH